MIVKEFFMERDDGVRLFLTRSDEGLLIRKVGTEEIYAEAIDVEDAPWTYEETDEPIPKEETPEEDQEETADPIIIQ